MKGMGLMVTRLPGRGPVLTKLPPAVPADVSSALFALGIDHVIRDDEAVGLCPNPEHDDRKPSWSCNLTTGLHNCFSCGFGGSFNSLVSTMRNISSGEARAWILTRRVRVASDDQALLEHVKEVPKVRESDLWECGDPPAGELAARRISLESARALEILWHPRKGCWVFPIRDPKTGRLLGWQEKSGHNFRNRPKDVPKATSLFGMRALKEDGPDGYVVVVESPLDVGRFRTAGINRVVSTYGIGFSDYQIELLWDYADEIIFAPDNDEAGHKKIATWIKENPVNRNKMRVFDYGGAFDWEGDFSKLAQIVHPKGDGRDPGNLTDRELRRGIEWATPAWRTRFEGIDW